MRSSSVRTQEQPEEYWLMAEKPDISKSAWN